jgi:hypothetical protein
MRITSCQEKRSRAVLRLAVGVLLDILNHRFDFGIWLQLHAALFLAMSIILGRGFYIFGFWIVFGNPEQWLPVKSSRIRPLIAFLVVFHSPSWMAETGLLACRSEKTGRVSRYQLSQRTFSSPV